MSWLALAYYTDRVDTLGGNDTDHDAELRYKIKRYVRQGCQRVEVFKKGQTIFPAGIREIKKGKVWGDGEA